MKPLPLLLLLAGTGVVITEAGEENQSFTTSWFDSTRMGDTTFYSKGRVVATIEVHTDSQWSVRPAVAQGLPHGPFHLPPDSLCTLGYTATVLTVDPRNVLQQLDRIRECQGHVFAAIRRAALKDLAGHLSVRAAQSELGRWPWPAVCARVKDSTIIGFYIADDINNDEWGPAPLTTRLAQWDTIASLILNYCPGSAVALRAMPTQLAARPRWLWATTAWAQYAGPQRHGPPEEYFRNQVASARKQGLGLVTGVNLLNGGCGPLPRRCLPDVPGAALPGTVPDDYQLSATELIYYKTAAMSDPYVCASVDWSWGPAFRSDFHSRPDVKSAAKALALIARQRPKASCDVA